MTEPTIGVPPLGIALPRAFASASACGFCSIPSGTLGTEVMPQTSSLLKKESPADVPCTPVSSSNAFERPPVMTDHLVGWLGSTATGFCSQLAESVVGGRLQFMLPLRSTKKSKFDGTRWLSNAEDAHESALAIGDGAKMIEPPAPDDSPPAASTAKPPVLMGPPLEGSPLTSVAPPAPEAALDSLLLGEQAAASAAMR